jgi:DNA (cytosine-5)-methyltransferase 1
MSLGFQNAGMEILAAFDNWEPAIRIYGDNFKHPVFNVDLMEQNAVEKIKALKPEMIIGGPPCQDFSIAGNRNMGDRAHLTIRFANIVSEVRPKWFVMENVYNIERMPILPKAKMIFKKDGYGLTIRILNASHCGVPQARRRFFMIGLLGENDDFLGKALDSAISKVPMTVRDYLGDTLDTQFYYMHPRSYNRRGVFSVDEPSATIRGVNRPIPQGYKKHHGDKANPSSDGGVRELTTKERSYIQTFPREFVFEGKKTDVEQAIGNAVPVKLAEFVAQRIIEFLHQKTPHGYVVTPIHETAASTVLGWHATQPVVARLAQSSRDWDISCESLAVK